MKDNSQPSVVFDKVLLDTFLSMAVQEGLLSEDIRKTDGFLSKYKTYVSSPRLREIVLEQVVLTPNIMTTQHVPIEYLSGLIAEKKSITRIEPPTDNLIKIGRFSKSIISAMLESRGHTIPEAEFEKRLSKASKALEEEDAYTKRTGKEPPNLFTKHFLDMMGTTLKHDYSAREYKAAEKRQTAYDNAKPLLDCMVEYLQLATIASKDDALMRIPTNVPAPIPVDNKLLNFSREEPEDIALVRIVAHKLGRLSYRDTLKESLELARDPNTAALRNKLIEWKNALAIGETDKLESILKEIEEAKSELSKLKSPKKLGRFVTYVSAPISLVEVITHLPSVLSTTASVVGFGTQLKIDITENKFKWAMFGDR